MTGNVPLENLAKPLERKSKSARAFVENMRHPLRGGKVNYLREPSFRGWLLAGVPFYALATKKRLPLWRWLLIVVSHLHLLDGEANNTAHEESIRSHRRQTWHFRNAMDSASFSVFLRATATLITVTFALFAPDPWSNKHKRGLSIQQQLDGVIKQRHLLTGELGTELSAARRASVVRSAVQLEKLERQLRTSLKAHNVENKLHAI